MAVREMQLGKGTIAYQGESTQYYDGKRGLWQRYGRWAFVAFLTIAGLIFVFASFTTPAVGRVAAVAPDSTGNAVVATVALPDGRQGDVLMPVGTTWVTGDAITVSVLPLGRMVYGNDAEQARLVGLIFLVGAGVMVAWGVRQDRRRRIGGEL